MDITRGYDGEGWLTPGWHLVKIESFDTFFYNSGSEGVKFKLLGVDGVSRGRKQEIAFCLQDTIIWRLGKFAKACGLPREQAASYDHHMLVNRTFKVLVVKPAGQKYGDCDDFASKETDTTINVTQTQSAPNVSQAPPDNVPDEGGYNPNVDDGIPF